MMVRDWRASNALPASLVERRARVAALAGPTRAQTPLRACPAVNITATPRAFPLPRPRAS